MEVKTQARCPKCGAITSMWHEQGESPFPTRCLADTVRTIRGEPGETRCMQELVEADEMGKKPEEGETNDATG